MQAKVRKLPLAVLALGGLWGVWGGALLYSQERDRIGSVSQEASPKTVPPQDPQTHASPSHQPFGTQEPNKNFPCYKDTPAGNDRVDAVLDKKREAGHPVGATAALEPGAFSERKQNVLSPPKAAPLSGKPAPKDSPEEPAAEDAQEKQEKHVSEDAQEKPAAEPKSTARSPLGEVWLLSTQEVRWGSDTEEASESIRYWRWQPPDQWQPAAAHTFFDHMASPLPTLIYIHGNSTTPSTALQQAWTIYRAVSAIAGERKFRLVVWAWPADRISGRPLTDLRLKAARSDVEAYHLAWHMKKMPPDGSITLVGYSFGARVITGALHLLGGGCVAGRSFPGGEWSQGRRVRAVLVAAAIGNDWILPGGRHERALSQMEQLLVTENWVDPALRWYPGLERKDSPALGRTGPVLLHCFDQGGTKIESLSVACWVGKQHDWRWYLTSPELQTRLVQYLFASPPSQNAPGKGASNFP